MPTTQQEAKLAILDPKWYNQLNDPVQKRFPFELSEAITNKPPEVTSAKPLPVPPKTTDPVKVTSFFDNNPVKFRRNYDPFKVQLKYQTGFRSGI